MFSHPSFFFFLLTLTFDSQANISLEHFPDAGSFRSRCLPLYCGFLVEYVKYE